MHTGSVLRRQSRSHPACPPRVEGVSAIEHRPQGLDERPRPGIAVAAHLVADVREARTVVHVGEGELAACPVCPKLPGPRSGCAGAEEIWKPVPQRAPSSGWPVSCGPAERTRSPSAIDAGVSSGEPPSTPVTHAAYSFASDAAELMPPAPGISAAWMTGLLNVTWPSSLGNANALPRDMVRMMRGSFAEAGEPLGELRVVVGQRRLHPGDVAPLSVRDPDPRVQAQRIAQRPTEVGARAEAGDPADHLAEQPADGGRVVGVTVRRRVVRAPGPRSRG